MKEWKAGRKWKTIEDGTCVDRGISQSTETGTCYTDMTIPWVLLPITNYGWHLSLQLSGWHLRPVATRSPPATTTVSLHAATRSHGRLCKPDLEHGFVPPSGPVGSPEVAHRPGSSTIERNASPLESICHIRCGSESRHRHRACLLPWIHVRSLHSKYFNIGGFKKPRSVLPYLSYLMLRKILLRLDRF
jgi:hypothetical protein